MRFGRNVWSLRALKLSQYCASRGRRRGGENDGVAVGDGADGEEQTQTD